MMKLLSFLFGIAMLLWGFPHSSQSAASPHWIESLRSGGYIIVIRHGATNPDQADTDPLNISDVTKQRHLNDQGRALARSMGEAMHKLKIPVGQVQTSMFYRAVETGRLLGYGEVRSLPDITEGGLVVTPRRIIGARKRCGGWSRSPRLSLPIAFSYLTSRTSWMRSEKNGSMCAKAKHRSSSRAATALSL